MSAAPGLIGEDHIDRVSPRLLVVVGCHLIHVVVVDERDVAHPLGHRLDLRAVVALRFAREVALDSFQPRLGLGLAVLVEHRRNQRDIIRMFARASANPPLPLRRRQVFITRDVAGRDAGFGCHQNARARGQPKPVTVRVAHARRDMAVNRRGVDRPSQVGVFDVRQPPDVHGEHHIGRAIGALVGEAFEHAGFGVDRVDYDAGLGGESVKHRRNQLRLAVGIDIDLAIGGGGDGERGGHHSHGGGEKRAK